MNQDRLRGRLFEWGQTATEDEKEVAEKVYEYESTYFDDMRFEPDSITGDFFALEIQDDSGKWQKVYEDTPSFISLSASYIFKISRIRGAMGRCYPKKHIICIHPKYKTDKTIILHEMIHAYEFILLETPLGRTLRDILYIRLYNSLKPKIKDIDKLIMAHAHILEQKDISERGGYHGILFYLKSLDLDLRLDLKPGTVCGYGRDIYTGEEI